MRFQPHNWSQIGVVVAAVVVVIPLPCQVAGHPRSHVVDLTHQIDEQTIYWPGNPNYTFTILNRGLMDPPGFWYESNAFSSPEHGGTHLDSPSHFYQGSYRTHQIPMEKLIGPGVIINVKEKVGTNPDYMLSRQDLLDWEKKYSTIPDGAVVVMNSGWTRKYPNKTEVFGTQSVTDPSKFHFPGFHEDAIDWLVRYRQVHVIAVDTPSIDPGQSTTFPVHVALGRANIPAVENIANIDAIPEHGAVIHVAPIKLYDGSGGPARVYAITTSAVSSASLLTVSHILHALLLATTVCAW